MKKIEKCNTKVDDVTKSIVHGVERQFSGLDVPNPTHNYNPYGKN
jgi:hypothetical protein